MKQKQQIIIFDLGGVLLRESESNLTKILPSHLANANTRIFNRMFEYVQLLSGKDCKRAWFLGKISGQEVVEIIRFGLLNKTHEAFFKNSEERELIDLGCEAIVLPQAMANLVELIEEGFEFVADCKSNGNRVMILSNWDPESFELIQTKFPQLFALFDAQDIIVPSKVGYMKPDKQVFEYISKFTATRLTELFFVDDSLANVQAALNLGVKAVHHSDWNTTQEKLIQYSSTL